MANKDVIDYQQLVKNSLIEIRKLKAKIAEFEQSADSEPKMGKEAIAVIGMACQFPTGKQQGAQDLDAFWQVLTDNVDAVIDAPEHRLSNAQFYSADPDAAGKIISTQGGYLNDIDQFAAEFFFVSSREAESMDPQQRLLLENHWRALEHAGIPPSSLMHTQTGLFAGICGNDYYHLLASRAYTDIDSYMASGTAHSIAVGRLAFYLGTQGPAIAVDTACSSSLVAMHLACQSLRAGECELALVSGVNALLSPEYSINFSRARMLSPDGRCKTFDDSANGYVRGEGCGVVVLKCLSDAVKDGDQILAVVQGSATNQDGRSSSLTAPNGTAQRQVLTQALQSAGLKAEQVSYVEAHGTGTSLGDPIEIEALQAVYGSHKQTPLNVGSVKSSIGHLEGAAGIAGFIKTVLMLIHGKIPKQLHFNTPNRHVDWSAMNLKVNQQQTDWTVAPDQQRIAGVSSFGFGGSNAHMLLAQAPTQNQPSNGDQPFNELLAISANNQDELKQLAQTYYDYLSANPSTKLTDFCYTTNARRDHFQVRAALTCSTIAEAVKGLQQINQGKVAQQNRVALLFSGQGAFHGALDDFSACLPVLATEFEQCDQQFKQQLNISLKQILFTESGAKHLLTTHYAQPALYCLQYVLAKTIMALGLEVECFIGHSVGEYVAACLAGVFSFKDGLKLVSHRGRLMSAMTEPAGMMAVLAESETVTQALKSSASKLCIAGYNGKTNTVVSGTNNDLIEFGNYLDRQGLAYKKLQVDRAFHSRLMMPMLDEFANIANSINYQSPTSMIISTKTGKIISDEIASANYWLDQITQPVLFNQTLAELSELGINLALEIGPQNILANIVNREEASQSIQAFSILNGHNCSTELMNTIADLYQRGLNINWQNYYKSFRGLSLPLPGYQFNRQRYWFKPSVRSDLAKQTIIHPLLQDRLDVANDAGKKIFSTVLKADNPALHQDHCYQGEILIPAAHYLEMALATMGGVACQITQVNYPTALIVENDQDIQLQLILTTIAEGYDCCIYSRAATDSNWQCHFNAQIQLLIDPIQPVVNPKPLTKSLDVDAFYQTMRERGMTFGPSYQLLDSLLVQDGQAQGRINSVNHNDRYYLYPPILDACFQVAGSLLPQNDNAAYLQIGMDSLSFWNAIGQQGLTADAQLRPDSHTDEPVFDIDIFDELAQPIAQVKGMRLRKMAQSSADGLFYTTQWQASNLFVDDINSKDINQWLTSISLTPENYWNSLGNTNTPYLPVLEAQALNYVIKALLKLGFSYQPGQLFSLQQCRQQTQVLPRYEKLLKRFLMVLTETKYLEQDNNLWRVVRPLSMLSKQQSAIDSCIEMQLLNQCGQSLAGVLTGATDFLPLLFSDNNEISASTLYSQADGFNVLNNSAVQALKSWLSLVPTGRKLKVLEIGAGTGGTTRHLLPTLAEVADFDYFFTDVSSAFFGQAAITFKDYPQLHYKTLDISQAPKHQGFTEHDFDLIIAANVIHATADLNETLAYVYQLLSQNGVLMLLEGLQPQLWVDLIFGLTEGWWAFTDDRRQNNYPLLDEKGWQTVLRQAGFHQPTLITPKLDASERLCQQSVILTQPRHTVISKHWLILKDQRGLADQVAAELNTQGDRCTLVSCGEFSQQNEGLWTVNPFQVEDFKQVIDEWLQSSEPAQRAVLNCWSLDAQINETTGCQDVEFTLSQLCAGLLHLVQALDAENMTLQALNIVTQGAQQVNNSDQLQPAMSALWGMARVVAKEYPQFHCNLLDLQTDIPVNTALFKQITQTVSNRDQQIAVRDQQLYVPRLVPCEMGDSKPLVIKQHGIYLVTGAFGGMGFKVTEWLIAQGAKQLLLLARSQPSEAIQKRLEQAREKGVTIHVEAVDVSDYDSLKQVVNKHCTDQNMLAGIFHSAGVFADCLLQDYDWRIFSKVFPAKVQGSWNLHQLTTKLQADLNYFVLFSSSASLLTPGGLANYVASNAFIDALAAYRHQHNLTAHSINWGVWQDTGMAAAVSDTRQQQWQVMGVKPMQVETALDAMQTVIGSNQTNTAIIDIDFDQYVKSQLAGIGEDFFQSVLSHQPEQIQERNSRSDSIDTLIQKNPDQQQELMLDYISQITASVVGISTEIDPRRGFFELGMDSLTSMELRNRLQRELEITLDATLTFKYPSVSTLSDHLLELLVSPKPTSETIQSVSGPQQTKQVHLIKKEGQAHDLSLDEQLDDIDRFLNDASL